MRSSKKRNERVYCKDGFSMSVQANKDGYCDPREDNAEHYTEVEIGYPSYAEPLIMPYREPLDDVEPHQSVYAYVPSDLVRHIIDKHGGIVSGEVPRGVPVYGTTHCKP